jgi:hypothetical protein
VSETKHTPGPWVAKPTGDTQWKVCHSGSEFGIVCVTSQGNDKANAELIAAAPDLLRALKDLREQVDAHVVVVGCSHFNTTLATEVIDRIAK